ncbi:MAG: HAD family phosphatase [Acidobacteria bacterium]|nr:HAD family phosphatase [Acidobacteriota bacterium]
MIRAVVFDFDGVLANSEPLHYRGYRDVLAPRGITLTERAYYANYLGYDDIGAFKAIGFDMGAPFSEADVAELVAQKAIRLEELEKTASVLFPGAREAIERMSAAGPVAIASGALKGEILRVLDNERLRPHFPIVVAAEDTPASKPDPAPYALAVDLLARRHPGLRAAECVAIEDSKWGLMSARGAGLRTVAITHTYPAAELADAADLVIEHLDQFTPELLRSL